MAPGAHRAARRAAPTAYKRHPGQHHPDYRVSDVRGYPWAYVTDRTGKSIGWVFENYLACG